METPKVFIGIIACNQKSKTQACLESLAASDRRDFDVFLIDNGSGEGIGEAASRFSFVKAETLPRNIGAAAGRNRILRYFLNQGNWPYLLFLDNDVALLPETLGTVFRRAEEYQAQGRPLGALGAHIVYQEDPGKCWSAGGALIDWQESWFREQGQGTASNGRLAEPRRLDVIPTAFLFAAREAVEKVGFFEEVYFFYFEDADWSWRMVQAGFELWSVPEAVVFHDVSSSLGKCSPQFYYLRTRNRLWFFQRFSAKPLNEVRWQILKSALRDSAYPELREGHFKEAAAVVRGFLDGIHLPKGLRTKPVPSRPGLY